MSWDTWKKRQFHIRFRKAEEGGYIVSIPEMPGCVTQAETLEEGLVMVKDALAGLLQVAVEHGDHIPEQFRDLVEELAASSASQSREQVAGDRQAARSQVG
jgi:antitoxin HicB